MSKLCQDCYSIARPTQYFPETFISGECGACGQTAFVGRVTKDDVFQARAELEATRDRLSDDEITREGRAMAQGGLI